MTNNKEIKEGNEIKDKTNDCTQVGMMQNAVRVTRERRYIPNCSAVNGITPKLLKFLKLLTARLVPGAKLCGYAV